MSRGDKSYTVEPMFPAFGDACRGLRVERGIMQREVAAAVGIARSEYSAIELGERKPTIELARSIAGVLGRAGWEDRWLLGLLGYRAGHEAGLEFWYGELVGQLRALHAGDAQLGGLIEPIITRGLQQMLDLTEYLVASLERIRTLEEQLLDATGRGVPGSDEPAGGAGPPDVVPE